MGELIETYMQKDKIVHAFVCAMITLYLYVVLHLFLNKWIALPIAALITAIIGALKEYADSKSNKHVASKKDFVADIFGIIVTVIPLIFI